MDTEKNQKQERSRKKSEKSQKQVDTEKVPTRWAPQKKQAVPPVRKCSPEELSLQQRAAEDLRMYHCDEWIDGDSWIRIRYEDVL